MPKAVFRDGFEGSLLDKSWNIGLNLALKEGLTWGRDVVFTYGPLGYLATGMTYHASKTWILVFHLFIVANAAFFIHHLLGRVGNWKWFAPLLVLLFFDAGFLFRTDTMSLFLYFVFHGWLFLKHGRAHSLALISIMAILSLYIKVNSGIVINVLFLFFCLANRMLGTLSSIRTAALLALHFGMIWVLSVVLRVDLPGYVVNGLSIIDAYNDAMYRRDDPFLLLCAVTALILLLLPYLKSLKPVISSGYEFFMAFQLSLLTYILFKQGFVRAHWYEFLTGIPFVALLAYLSTSVDGLRSDLHVSVIAISMVSIVSIGSIWENRFERIKKTFRNPVSLEYERNVGKDARIREESTLPANVLDRIGDRGTDVLGFLISHVHFNGLKYNPRPVFQSYSAYSPRLIDLNHDKYAGESAPHFILYHFGSIDDRFPFWDEPRTYLPLMANYRMADTIPPKGESPAFLLFERSPVRKTLKERVVLDTVVGLNSRVTVPRNPNLLFLQMDCELTMPGSVRRLLYEPPGVGMELTYEEGSTQTGRIILPVMKSGVPINKKVTTEQEAFEFFRSGASRSKSTDSFKILADPFWVRKGVRVRFIEYVIG